MQQHEIENWMVGLSNISAEVPAPMKILMQENSRALETITSSVPYSGLPKPSKDQGC